MLHLGTSYGKCVITSSSKSKVLSIPYNGKEFIEGKILYVEFIKMANALFISTINLPNRSVVEFDGASFKIPKDFFFRNQLIPYPDYVMEMVLEAFYAFITTEPVMIQRNIIKSNASFIEQDFFDFSVEDSRDAINFFSEEWKEKNYILRFFETKESGLLYKILTTPVKVADSNTNQQLTLFS